MADVCTVWLISVTLGSVHLEMFYFHTNNLWDREMSLNMQSVCVYVLRVLSENVATVLFECEKDKSECAIFNYICYKNEWMIILEFLDMWCEYCLAGRPVLFLFFIFPHIIMQMSVSLLGKSLWTEVVSAERSERCLHGEREDMKGHLPSQWKCISFGVWGLGFFQRLYIIN